MSIHILWTDPLQEVVRQRNGKKRWCFTCRKRRDFEYVVQSPAVMSSYGPTPHIECSVCHTHDSDLFPGHIREWE